MKDEELRRLLRQSEGPTLEFKREWYKIDDHDADLLPFLVPGQTRVAPDCWVDNAAICAGVW